MKVLYAYVGAGSPVLEYERRLINSINQDYPSIKIDFWDWTRDLCLFGNPSLEWAFRNRDRLASFYKILLEKSKSVDVALIGQTGGILPEVMEQISAQVVYITADDPDSSESCSFPFLKAADIIAYCGVCFDEKRRLEDVFLERGAKRCIHFPLGFYEEMFPKLEDFDTQFHRRNIDLIYVGHLKRGKLERIMNRFKNMAVYSRSLKLKHKAYIFAKTGRWVRPYVDDIGSLYMRCKVGINIHYTFGPSNVRTYQLNAAGVAQVIDCPEGISEIYEPKAEVMVYSSIDEAVHQIEHLLNDDEFRYLLSKNGYERARRDYNRKKTITKLLLSL